VNQPPRDYRDRLVTWTELELDTDEPYKYNREHVSKRPSPPPAYQPRENRRYRYYPDANVYYWPDRNIWFVMTDGGWRSVNKLPRDYNNRLGDWSDLELDTDEPYKYNRDHVKKYPPRKYGQ
jgi:hypothetical protein